MINHGSKKPMTERAHYQQIHARCINLGVWRDEFSTVARRLAKIYVRIAAIEDEITAPTFSPLIEHTNKGGATNLVKNPLLSQIDALYDQALTYERELALTPAAHKRVSDAASAPAAESPFTAIMKKVMDT